MDHNHTFFKFMHDLIDSGIWGKLSSTARTLYPVLCRFSNETFKEVWPGTDELLRLTGFKTKKSLQQAKKDLVEAGLLDIIPGSGRTPSKYYFKFEYKNSKIDLNAYRDTIISLRGANFSSPKGDDVTTYRDKNLSPNNINININTNNEKQTKFYENVEKLFKEFFTHSNFQKNQSYQEQIIQNMLDKYGNLETGEAIKIAIERGKSGDIKYLEGILRNRNSQLKTNPQGKNNKGDVILKELNVKYHNICQQLQFYYYYDNTYYFKSNSTLNHLEIEKYAQNLGYNIKIIFATKNNNDLTEIQFLHKNY